MKGRGEAKSGRNVRSNGRKGWCRIDPWKVWMMEPGINDDEFDTIEDDKFALL